MMQVPQYVREEGIEREGKVNAFSSKSPVRPHVWVLSIHWDAHLPGSKATIENMSNKEQPALVRSESPNQGLTINKETRR